MICISVTPESRQLAKVDLLNASRYADLIELCLDRLLKAPDVGELKEGLEKPLIVSCRTEAEGGQFKGSIDDQVAILKQAIISGPDYIELDLEVAKQIPRFGETKRVISITSLDKPVTEIGTMFDQAWSAKADVVKFTSRTDTLETAWPLLKAVVDKRELPVVGLGIGKCGVTFSLLGRKYGSPWLYAALEKGMEAFPGQTTAFELEEAYNLSSISSQTRFLGLVGYDNTQALYAKILNRGFAKIDSRYRLLPMQIQSPDKIEKRLDVLKINGLIVNPASTLNLAELATKTEESVDQTSSADLLFRKKDQWQGFNLSWRVMLKEVEAALEKQQHQLNNRNVLVFGGNALARSMIYGLKRRDCVISITSPDDRSARETSALMGIRHVPFMNVYDTLCDVAIIVDPSIKPGPGRKDLNPGFFRPEMTIADFSQVPMETDFAHEAKERNCHVIEPKELGYDYLSAIFKAVTGKPLDRDIFDEAVTTI